MTDRKPPSIDLAPLSGAGGEQFRRDGDRTARQNLAAPELYEGVLLRRSCAAILDFTIAFVLSLILTLATCTASVFTLGLLSIPAILVAPVVIHALMAGFMIAGPSAATWGMRAFGVRVAALNGQRLDHVQAFLMVAMYFASVTIFFPVLLMGLFMERGRLLHDLVSGTVVIRSNPD
ncbi:RDD family protein [Dongia sp.]|uniref:RDD family protein n=1 Tax=Dongia sp. TaxID=1977262 RepID=UPI0035B2782D